MLTIRNDVTKIKAINTELIKQTLIALGEATKAMISEHTGISVATCGKILNEMCSNGEVLEVSKNQADYGRPSKSYAFNALYKLVACLYVFSDNHQIVLSTVVSDLVGGAIHEDSQLIEAVNFDVINDAVSSLLEQQEKIAVLSIGIPGYVSNGIVGLCNFKELVDLSLEEMLQQNFPNVKIIVENDMNAASFGFYKTLRNPDTTVGYLFSPKGVRTGTGDGETWYDKNGQRVPGIDFGAGFVSGGRILRGYSGFAGELWYLPVNHTQEAMCNPPTPVKLLSDIISSVIPVLNPEVFALTGSGITENTVTEIREQCLKLIPPQHLPKLILRRDIHVDYMNGLKSIALEHLSCDVLLVKKDI